MSGDYQEAHLWVTACAIVDGLGISGVDIIDLLTADQKQQIVRRAMAERAARDERQAVRHAETVEREVEYNRYHAERVLARTGDSSCRSCGSTEDLTVDHILPRSRGGGNERENLQALCRTCNSSKGARTMEEWLQASPAGSGRRG